MIGRPYRALYWDIFFDGVYLGSCTGYDAWDAIDYWVFKNPELKLDLEIYSALFFAFPWVRRK